LTKIEAYKEVNIFSIERFEKLFEGATWNLGSHLGFNKLLKQMPKKFRIKKMRELNGL